MKNKEITIYELIGLIKDGKAPAKIKFRDEVYYWSYDTYTKNISTPDNQVSLFREYRIDYCLNQKIEILPEENDEWEDIEEYDLKPDDWSLPSQADMEIQKRLNTVIKNQKYLKEKLENNTYFKSKVEFTDYIDEYLKEKLRSKNENL